MGDEEEMDTFLAEKEQKEEEAEAAEDEERREQIKEEITMGVKEQYPEEADSEDIKERVDTFAEKKLREEQDKRYDPSYQEVMQERAREEKEEMDKRKEELGLAEDKKDVDQKELKYLVERDELKEKQQRLKSIEHQRKLSEQKIRSITRGDIGVGLLGTQVGAMLGFSRYGTVGKQISTSKIKDKGARIEAIKDHIKILEKQKEAIKKDPEKIKDVNELMKEIGKMEELKQTETDKLKRLQIAEAYDDSFKYTKIGGPTQTKKGKKSQSTMGVMGTGKRKTTPTGKINLAKFGKRFEKDMYGIEAADRIGTGDGLTGMDKIIQNLNKLSQQKYTATPSRRMIPADDDGEVNETNQVTKPRPRFTNEFGVDDWILNM